ncbi:MAG: terminase large subunit domain-containing protein, partial [Streptosporangiaceae bacterium]
MPPTPRLSRADVARSLENPAVFAEILCGEPLWPHQEVVACSAARYRVLCAGRQAGKSRLLAVLALHEAFTVPGSRTLVVSAGEDAAKRVLAEVAALALGSPLLAGSVLDESKSVLVLSTGSTVLSVPASQRQVRGWAIDLLIGDEAGFWPQELWQAAEPVIIARRSSRVVLCSTPWGGGDHFFRKLWQRGMDRPDGQVAGWHWPSSVSPLVDKSLLAGIEERETPDYFAREYLAQWTDEAGVYFTEQELS